VSHKRSWLSLIGFCLMTALGAATVFAIIVAGGSMALASHHSVSAEEIENNAAATPQISAATQQQASPTQEHSDQQDDARAAPQHSDLASFSGLVTDSHCAARHRRHSNLTPEDCARACLRNGASYVLVDGDRRYKLSGDEESLNKLLGTRATIKGTLQGQTISVSSVGPQL